MTKCRLTVRAPEGVWQGEVDDWTGFVVLAALSAEPESFAELAEAVRRYLPQHRLFDQPRPTADGDDTTADGRWCLVDLVGRTVVAGADFELPDPRGAYEANEDEATDGFPIVWLDTPSDWAFQQAGDDWRSLVAARAATRTAAGPVDARAVLFGPPLLEHLAAGVLAARTGDATDGPGELEQTRAIHAAWLMTPRADLGGRTPRDVLLAQRHRIDADLDHRAQQWSRQGHPAPALAVDCAAYRWGGFGITQVVLYFDLVRALLAYAWDQAKQGPRPTQPVLVGRLAECRDWWLDNPNEESGPGMTPAELMESERRRMPVTGGGGHLFDDCPLCQAQASGEFGPMFMHFDGHHLELEEEFVFSLCQTREEWEQQEKEFREMSEAIDRQQRERAAASPDADDPLAGSVWQSSFVDWDGFAGADAPPGEALLALGFPLAELTGNLRPLPEGADLLRSLNQAYAGLRTSQDAAATNSAAQEFRELLESAGQKYPDLTSRCADLQSRLDEVLRRLS
jgi:hypothetical protein